MAEILWRTEYRDGAQWLFCNLAELGFRLEDDGQASGMFLAVAAPLGGVASLGTVLAKGDRGFAPSLELASFTELDDDDPAAAVASLDLLAEGTDVSGPVYGLNLSLHRGVQGVDGAAIIVPADYGDPELGWNLTVAAGLAGFELTPPRVPSQHWPATVDEVPGGTTAGYTQTIVSVPAKPFDWYPDPEGTVQVVASSGTNLRVDLLARLGSDSGPVVGRDYGVAGAKDKLHLVSGPDAGASLSSTKVLAGNPANIHFRTEKQAGSATYSSVAGTSRYSVKVIPA